MKWSENVCCRQTMKCDARKHTIGSLPPCSSITNSRSTPSRSPERCASATRFSSTVGFPRDLLEICCSTRCTWFRKQITDQADALHRTRRRSLDGRVKVVHLRGFGLRESASHISFLSPATLRNPVGQAQLKRMIKLLRVYG